MLFRSEIEGEIQMLADGRKYKAVAEASDAEGTFGGMLPHFTQWVEALDAAADQQRGAELNHEHSK